MEGLNFKKHKQSKYFTIMLVPYSSKKTASIRIPHWFLYAFVSFAGVVAALFLISHTQANRLKLQADTINEKLSEAWQINSKLTEEKALIESNALSKDSLLQNQQEAYKETLEREQDIFKAELKRYEEKARELEEKINELEEAKNELSNLLSKKADNMVNVNVSYGEGKIEKEAEAVYTFLSFTKEQIPDTLETTYLRLEEMLETQATDYGQLIDEAKRIKPYLDAKPSMWPVWGIVTNEVEYRPNPFSGRGSEYHTGLDIAVPTGTSVKAAGAGKVTFAGWNGGYGYLVMIDHGYGIVSMYGHNSKILVSEGDTVSRGDIIAKSGSTGRSTGPHVHYEIQVNGVIKNPRSFID